jgi:hypothetical protein
MHINMSTSHSIDLDKVKFERRPGGGIWLYTLGGYVSFGDDETAREFVRQLQAVLGDTTVSEPQKTVRYQVIDKYGDALGSKDDPVFDTATRSFATRAQAEAFIAKISLGGRSLYAPFTILKVAV